MAQSPKKKLQHEIERIKKYGRNGELPEETCDALLEWMRALHPEIGQDEYVTPSGETKEFAILTIQTYLREMRKVAERAVPNLLEIDAETFNEEIDAMQTGDNPEVKDGGLAKTTLAVTQSAGRTFVWHHGIAHPDEVTVYGETREPKHDQGDVFSRSDVTALRRHVQGPRNRAILEMLLNTGQRISAIQGLRIKDVDTNNGWFRLNTNRDGLKRAARRGRKRPLLGAKTYLEDWIEAHPFSDDPHAFLFIGDPDHHKTKPEEPLCQGTIRRFLQLAAESAGVEKPVNPHNFRHFWTTTMKQEYDLNDEEIKPLMGDKRESVGINSVYNHTDDTKLRKRIRSKTSPDGEWTTKSLTPTACNECGESLKSHWRVCPICGTAYGPPVTDRC